MDKCIACQHYDRQHAKSGEAKGVQWGQCRRSAPMLHPVNAKAYMIEGVWPHVRDDDWCGEWKVATRRTETRRFDLASGPLVAGFNASTSPASVPRAVAAPNAMSRQAYGEADHADSTSTFGTYTSAIPLVASGRGD